jgi:hypothetical protein
MRVKGTCVLIIPIRWHANFVEAPSTLGAYPMVPQQRNYHAPTVVPSKFQVALWVFCTKYYQLSLIAYDWLINIINGARLGA